MDFSKEKLTDDQLLHLVESHVISQQNASISNVQRVFRVGFNQAFRIFELLEKSGVLSEPSELGKRKVLKLKTTE